MIGLATVVTVAQALTPHCVLEFAVHNSWNEDIQNTPFYSSVFEKVGLNVILSCIRATSYDIETFILKEKDLVTIDEFCKKRAGGGCSMRKITGTLTVRTEFPSRLAFLVDKTYVNAQASCYQIEHQLTVAMWQPACSNTFFDLWFGQPSTVSVSLVRPICW